MGGKQIIPISPTILITKSTSILSTSSLSTTDGAMAHGGLGMLFETYNFALPVQQQFIIDHKSWTFL